MAERLESSQEAGPGPASELAAAASHALLQACARHHGMMAALAGAAPAFPAAAQLAGRWLAAQMLSNQLRQEALELLVAAAFLPERGLPVPGQHALPIFPPNALMYCITACGCRAHVVWVLRCNSTVLCLDLRMKWPHLQR